MIMVTLVILVTYVPTQPSMIEAWSLDDLRFKVHERELQRTRDLERDRPVYDSGGGKGAGPMPRRKKHPAAQGVRWTHAFWGALIAGSGTLWMLSILGFEVPWFAAIPVGLVIIGSFIIASALNLRTGCAGASDDRCDH
jgi:hypothetical protein